MIRVVLAGVTGWVGRALLPAIVASSDLKLVAAVSRSAAGRDAGEAIGAAPLGVTIVATLAEALATPPTCWSTTPSPMWSAATSRGDRRGPPCRGRHLRARRRRIRGDRQGGAREERRRARGGKFLDHGDAAEALRARSREIRPDVEIIDYAGAAKPDTPSGTGRELAEALAAMRGAATSKPVDQLGGIRETRGAAVGDGPNGGVRVHALRMPSFVLSVEAVFGADNERLDDPPRCRKLGRPLCRRYAARDPPCRREAGIAPRSRYADGLVATSAPPAQPAHSRTHTGACSGKVDAGFPKSTCANAKARHTDGRVGQLRPSCQLVLCAQSAA